MYSDPPSPLQEAFLDKVYQIFPSLRQDNSLESLVSGDLQNISPNLPTIMKKIPYHNINHAEYIEKMRKQRDIQEERVHNSIKEFKEIDFIEEASKYNPGIKKAMDECSNTPLALERIMRESEQRIEDFKRDLKARCDAIFEEDKKETSSYLQDQGSWEINSQKCESEDSLSFLDLKSLKRTHSDLGIDFEHEFRREDERDNNSPNNKPKKIVLYSTSKRYVFGFDKVENLMEPALMEDELMVDNGRDILREINNIHNFDNNGTATFKFLNFS